jgi:nitroreductase/FMN reductase [NAD(P)H]
MSDNPKESLQAVFNARYADAPSVGPSTADLDALKLMASRGSCRSFQNRPVPADLLEVLCAAALASPTKSDLQQRDIILLQSDRTRYALAALVQGQAWVAEAPVIAVFCGNNRRHRLIHEWHDIPFANDHLDAFFNAVGDAAIALGAFGAAAEAVGLGCCPVSTVRNEAEAVSELLGLPQHVFPFAGLALGYPRQAPVIAKRLPLRVTRHFDRYGEEGLKDAIEAYDIERAKTQPYGQQRATGVYGITDSYGWSDDKTRQYSKEERADFGAYIRKQGFRLD